MVSNNGTFFKALLAPFWFNDFSRLFGSFESLILLWIWKVFIIYWDFCIFCLWERSEFISYMEIFVLIDSFVSFIIIQFYKFLFLSVIGVLFDCNALFEPKSATFLNFYISGVRNDKFNYLIRTSSATNERYWTQKCHNLRYFSLV